MELRRAVEERKRKSSVLDDLYHQRQELKSRKEELFEIKNREQKDVDKLEKSGLTSFFYEVIGKKDEKLDKEKQEAYEAALKYNTVAGELENVEREITGLQDYVRELPLYEVKLRKAIEEKKEWLKENNPDKESDILKLESEIAYLESQLKEVREAIDAGKSARISARNAKEKLGSAKNWGVYDLVGGGMISGLAKHSALDEAQNHINNLQMNLRRFQTELADININGNVEVGVGNFCRFADIFWDNIFVDWAVLDKINNSLDSITSVERKITDTLSGLETMKTHINDEVENKKKELEELVALA